MGMFDDLRCDLPIGTPTGTVFQTKDLECQLEHYTLTADGRLIHHDADWETTPKAERPYPDAPEGSIEEICGMIRRVPGSQRDVDTNFDGDVTFYTAEDTFRATFRGGDCLEICKWVDGGQKQVWKRAEVRMWGGILRG